MQGLIFWLPSWTISRKFLLVDGETWVKFQLLNTRYVCVVHAVQWGLWTTSIWEAQPNDGVSCEGTMDSNFAIILLFFSVLLTAPIPFTDLHSTHLYIYTYTLWLFNIAMENGPFIDDFPIKPPICKGFSMAMLNNQMVYPLKNESQKPWALRQILEQALGGILNCAPRLKEAYHDLPAAAWSVSRDFPMIFPMILGHLPFSKREIYIDGIIHCWVVMEDSTENHSVRIWVISK